MLRFKDFDYAFKAVIWQMACVHWLWIFSGLFWLCIQSCHLTNGLCALSVAIFLTAISIKEFSKEAISLHKDVDILNGFFSIPITANNDIVRLLYPSQKQMEISPDPPAQQEMFFFYPFYLEVTLEQGPGMSVTISD